MFLILQKRTKRNWTKEEEEYLVSHITENVHDIAAYLKRTDKSVQRKIYNMGLNQGRFYTKEQIEYIKDNPDKENAFFAKKFGKNLNSIRKLRQRLGLPGESESRCIDVMVSELDVALGKSKGYTMKVWRKKGLKTRSTSHYTYCKFSEIERFMLAHPECWDVMECDQYFFEQFDWFNKKRKEAVQEMIRKRWENVG